jgi:hypothetical protein
MWTLDCNVYFRPRRYRGWMSQQDATIIECARFSQHGGAGRHVGIGKAPPTRKAYAATWYSSEAITEAIIGWWEAAG